MDLCVLSLLKKKEYYGYELVQTISKHIAITEGTIYPILRRLKNDGFLTTKLKPSSQGPSRKYYAITEAGKQQEKQLKNEWTDFEQKVGRLLDE